MSRPIAYIPTSANSTTGLQDCMQSGSSNHHAGNHSESRIAAEELLEQARRDGILDALHGIIGAKDKIIEELAGYASKPEAIVAFRNVLILAGSLGRVEPGCLSGLAEAVTSVRVERTHAPSLWQLLKQMNRPDTRRGLSALLGVAEALGKANHEHHSV